jgi:hypothetical protein
MRRGIPVAVAAAAALLLVAAPAEAANAQQIADNIKTIMLGIAASVYIGIVAVVALKFLPGRHYVELGVFLLFAVVIGGIVLMPSQTVGTVKDIYRSVVA